jgi:release factor glutamine methyltransferase
MTTVNFAGLELLTAPGVVMTPRSTSVVLVDRALEHVRNSDAVVVDVGTGSGAIAIAIARSAPRARVWATDVSAEAVALARRNAARSGVAIRARRGHLLDPVPGRIDVVVANLPYLPFSERAAHPELVDEPAEAVFALGDGLDAYRRLAVAAEERLSANGLLAVQLRGELVAVGAHELSLLDSLFGEAAA